MPLHTQSLNQHLKPKLDGEGRVYASVLCSFTDGFEFLFQEQMILNMVSAFLLCAFKGDGEKALHGCVME